MCEVRCTHCFHRKKSKHYEKYCQYAVRLICYWLRIYWYVIPFCVCLMKSRIVTSLSMQN